MKNNDYLEKYGEKALQVYKKSFKANEQSNAVSPHKLPLKKSSKSSKKNLLTSKSKSKIVNQTDSNPTYPHKISLPQKGKKKLLLSGMSTPKNKTLKGGLNKDERNRSTSTKKKQTNDKISQKLHDAVYNSKSTKSMLRNAVECLDLIAQEENKIAKWINQFRQIMFKMVDELNGYKQKYKVSVRNNKNLEKQIRQLKEWKEIKESKERNHSNYDSLKKKSMDVSILQENQALRQNIRQLKQKISQYERKEMALIGVIEQLKVKSPQKQSFLRECSLEKKQRKMRGQFYEEREEQQQSSEEESQYQH